MTKILVCGGRDFNDFGLLNEVLGGLVDRFGQEFTIIEGGARGADSMAGTWAEIHNKSRMKFPADWNTYGSRAGPLRNQQMIDEGKPDLVIAFPGGRGTADMVRRAEAAKIETIIVEARRR